MQNPADPASAGRRTNQQVTLERSVPGTPEKVLALWTSKDGVRAFFAADARIEPRPGGPYEIIFLPALDPAGDSHGTRGARVIAYEPGRRLAFEWISFVADGGPERPGSPPASTTLRNERPIPTWVEITVTPDTSLDGHTRIRLEHRGFRTGPPWDEALAYFEQAWTHVLDSLDTYCRTGRTPAFGAAAGR